MMAVPGATRYAHSGMPAAPLCQALRSMLPQLKFRGSPRPRNESVVSERMAMATTSTVLAKMSGKTLGRMWRRMVCVFVEPMALARSTNCSLRSLSVSARSRSSAVQPLLWAWRASSNSS